MAQPIYYKATRATDPAVDFHTGQVVYRVGKTARPLPHDGTPSICGPGYLHASDTPSETLVGGTWPCRLFEVTGKVHAGFDSYHAHKGGFKQLRVVREIDPYLALGPNGRYVAGIIERTRKVTYDEATQLRAAWGAAWDAARGAAWGAAWDAAWGAARGAARGAAWGAARDAARDAARGAALALLTRDLITPKQFDRLYGPWAKVIASDPNAMMGLAPEWNGID
ncbi:MAG: hypothetical protein KGL39_58300 [Patescibacteria group bacterium]|nr:hypothetical protein [Patescibacteria group bacterium]